MIRILVLLLLAVPAFAQTSSFTNLDDSLTGWQYNPPCQGSQCAGGSGLPTSTTLTIVNSPSMDGTAAKFSMTAPALNVSNQTTNVLWPKKVGPNNNFTSFVGTYHIFIPSIANIAALEFDQFQFNNGQRYMFGSECDKGGNWRIWNQQSGQWVLTPAPCGIFTENTWHSIVWTTHRNPGDPAMYYDSLVVDGTIYSEFQPQPSAPSSDPSNNGIQFQIDESAAGGTVNVFVDEMSLSLTAPFVGTTIWGSAIF